MLKNLIIHIPTGVGDHAQLKRGLHQNPLFTSHYDGFEHTIKTKTIISTRLYYYRISHRDVYAMLKHLQDVGTPYQGYKIKILPVRTGNFIWD